MNGKGQIAQPSGSCDVPPDMRRVSVVGSAGSGKTTLARELASILGVEAVEIDAIHWGPGWESRPFEIWSAELAERLLVPGWVADGNYREARSLTWGQADTLVWLDYHIPLILWRLFWRTLARVRSGEELWNGNRETWRGAFLSRDSLFVYVLTTHHRRRKAISQMLREPAFCHLRLVRLYNPRQTRDWLARVRAAYLTPPQ